MPIIEITGTSGADSLVGTAAEEEIHGLDGNDTINATGFDSLSGDIAYGDEGDDWISGIGMGKLALHGGDGNDYITGQKTGYGQVHAWGDAGNDRIVMNLQNNNGWGTMGVHAYGGQGADRFEFVSAGSTIKGMINRIDDFDFSRDSIWLDGVQVNLAAPASPLRIIEFQGQQWIQVSTTVIVGLEGARLIPVQEADGSWVEEEESHITNFFPTDISALPTVAFIDPVNFVPFAKYSAVAAGLEPIYGGSGQNPVNGTTGNDNIWTHHFEFTSGVINGNAGNDVIDANTGHDSIFGGIGNDLIAGGLDRDVIHGDDGNDEAWGGSENDVVYGDAGNDSLHGGKHEDSLYGGTGNDVLEGDTGNDLLDGGSENDTLVYTIGSDTIAGGAGTDTLIFSGATATTISIFHNTNNRGITFSGIENLTGGDGADNMIGNAGANTLIGNVGNDTLSGYGGNDSLLGGNGDDSHWGLAGNDTINGGAGHDKIEGGDNIDLMTGGGGNDTFQYYTAAQGGDTITDFGATAGSNDDRFYIQASGFAGGLTVGALAATRFWANTTGLAHDADDRFIFETDTKELYYDIDGNGAALSVLIATLQLSATNLTSVDIVLF